MQHNDVIRESFTTQAQAFAANPWVTDEERIRRLVAAARLKGDERVLDIATGPGYIAEAFAGVAREVVGVDLTEAMLAIGKQRTQERGVTNVFARPMRKASPSRTVYLMWLCAGSRCTIF